MSQTTSIQDSQLPRERLGGFALIAAAALALVLANSPLAGAYQAIQRVEILKELAIFLFFLSVGIELRHEIRHGSLRNPKQAIVPIFAAIGGMLVPVILFSLINSGMSTAKGWGVPMSTDIAFALAIFAIAGRGLPKALRTFVMTVAVVDDSLTILMIAVFFTASFNILTVVSLAGVVIGLFMPGGNKLAPKLGPVVAFAALPLFAFYSAGVSLGNVNAAAFATPLALGVLVGQLVGKPLGVLGTAWLVTKSRLGSLAHGLTWADLRAVGWLFAMCFTVSMLMVELNFPAIPLGTATYSSDMASDWHTIAVLSVFVATSVAGLISTLLLRRRAGELAK
ncbi:MAG: Na+/H+ antiporter NhaA [Actinomycetales bacterium]|nr:Na+/H+ antiporter NhaA [Actinomycetales bacterium]